MKSINDELISYTHNRTYNYLLDTNTFLWAKFHEKGLFERQTKTLAEVNRLGGGNLLAGSGLFTAITYLSKILWLLEGNELKSASSNESETFINLILKAPVGKLGLSNKIEILRLFNIGRHKLVHLLAGGGQGKNTVQIMAFGPDTINDCRRQGLTTYKKIMEHLHLTDSPSVVLRPDGVYVCKVELFARDTAKICDWLCTGIANDNYPKKHIIYALTWIKKQLEEDIHAGKYL